MKSFLRLEVWLPIALFGLLLAFYQRNQALRDQAGDLRKRVEKIGRFAQIGLRAPTEAIPRLGGGDLQLFHPGGDGLILIYFSPSCPGCEKAAAGWAHLGPTDERTGEEIVGVSAGPPDLTAKFVRRHSLRFPVGLDPDGELADTYGIVEYPHTLVFDREGILQFRELAWQTATVKRQFLEAASLRPAWVVDLAREFLPSSETATLTELGTDGEQLFVLEGKGDVQGFAALLARPVNSLACSDLEALAFFGREGRFAGFAALRPHFENDRRVDLRAVGETLRGSNLAESHSRPIGETLAAIPTLGRSLMGGLLAVERILHGTVPPGEPSAP